MEKKGKEEPRLPALNYTGDQLFFIGAAQVNADCTRMFTKIDRLEITVPVGWALNTNN